MEVINIGFDNIGQFSTRDKEYHLRPETFQSLINFKAELESFPKMIEERKKYPVDRSLLTNHLIKQYGDTSYDTIKKNISLLSKDNCYTVCTAHQPSLLTGPLYYILKSLSTIHLADKLSKTYKEYHFVPVFVHGSEDHDFEEINHLTVFNKSVVWPSKETGSTGRMTLNGISSVLDEVEEIIGKSHYLSTLLDFMRDSLKQSHNYGHFVMQLNDFLMGKYGLIQLSMDDYLLKKAFTDIIKKEIIENFSAGLVTEQIDKLSDLSFKAQASPREINLFYLTPGGRNRIVADTQGYKVLDTNLSFSKEEILADIENHPENYSPNVIIRPLYQERILPNLAYVGGGGEIAYWLERKTQFAEANISFPILIRRNSAAIIDRKKMNQWNDLGLSMDQWSDDIHALEKSLVALVTEDQTQLDFTATKAKLQEIYTALSLEIKQLDPTLEKSTLSELQKSDKGIHMLESKLTRSLKKQHEVKINRLRKVHATLFPDNSLQERKTNFLEFYSKEGPELLDNMLESLNPLDKDFKLFVLD